MKDRHTLRRWELALLLGLGVSLLSGAWLSGQSRALAGRVIRLHVIAGSDSDHDQAVKLKVRDAVLSQTEEWMDGVHSSEMAEQILTEHLAELAYTASETAGTCAAVSLKEGDWFPTREYDGFALPAGRYTALRITLGEGKGRNWWCVVFPPLCMEPAAIPAGGFSEDQVKLITGDGEDYQLRFKALELWDRLTHLPGG